MKRKPITYTVSWGDAPSLIAINCETRDQALSLLELEYDERDDFKKPTFIQENIEHDMYQYCKFCNYWWNEGTCFECDRNLKGKYYDVYWIKLEDN